MAKYIQGSAVPNATSYKLFNYSTGTELATQNSGGAISFDLSALNLAAGTYTLAVKAYDSTGTYATSAYSNTVSYTVAEDPVNPPSSGTQVTTGSLAGAYFYERAELVGTTNNYTGVCVNPDSAYFVYEKIPVTGGAEITIVKGRAYFYSDSNGTPIMANQGNLTSGATNFTTTVPVNAAYITVAFKYDDIQPSAVELISSSWGTPTTTLLKDTGAIYMAETGILSQKTNPSTYTEPGSIAGWFTYHLIPVTGGNKYKIENGRLANWYDSNKQFISQMNFNINVTIPSTRDWSHIAPTNAAYLSICINNNDMAKDAVAMVEYPKA